MRKISAYEIALSALACALSTTILVLGVYSDILVFTGYLLASITLMLPLAKKSWWGYALAYIATCILAFLFGAARFWDIIPFAIFFGLHPFANELQLHFKINRWVAFAIKAVWFDGALFAIWAVLYFVTKVTLVGWYIIPIILVAGTALFFAYDYAMFQARDKVNALVRRIIGK